MYTSSNMKTVSPALSSCSSLMHTYYIVTSGIITVTVASETTITK